MNTNTTITEVKDFIMPGMMEGDFSNAELMEDSAGLNMSFQRIKIPGGGTLQFEIRGDDPENPDYERTITGVILYNHPAHAFWLEDETYDDSALPLCSSIDGVNGVGEPGGSCAACPLNAWGSGANGKGKACKNMRILYILRSGEVMPVQLTLPPTSLKPYNEFANICFTARRRGTCGSVVQIGLKKENNGKDDYSVATFRKIGDFDGEQLAQIKAYAEGFRTQIKMMNQNRALDAANRTDETPVIGGNTPAPALQGGGDVLSYTGGAVGQIDGDREEIPA